MSIYDSQITDLNKFLNYPKIHKFINGHISRSEHNPYDALNSIKPSKSHGFFHEKVIKKDNETPFYMKRQKMRMERRARSQGGGGEDGWMDWFWMII